MTSAKGSCFCGAIRFTVAMPTLFCETSRHPDVVDIVLANMNEPIDRPPQAHFYFDDRVDWVCVDDGLPPLGAPDASGG